MHYLIILTLAIISILSLKLYLNMRLRISRSHCQITERRHAILSKEHQIIKDLNEASSRNVQDLIEFYEITKELTKYLAFDEVLVVFRGRLKEGLDLADCQFVNPEMDTSYFSEYELFPVKIDKNFIGHLAVKGLRSEDRDKFFILFNQFLLVLKRVRLYAKIEELAITDSLTGLFLRRYFQERLEEEIKRYKKFKLQFVLLMLDLDHFKSYNDRYGHLVGDAVLSTVARIIKENVRQIDIVARYGGEEFSIILPNTDKQEAEYVSSRLRQSIEREHIYAYDEDLQITISIGGSFFPRDARDAQDLIDKADKALYRAKQAGRNRDSFWS